MNTYGIGQGVDLTFYFRDAVGRLADPSSATFEIEDPSGNVTPHTLPDMTRLDVGTYLIRVVPRTSGRWYYRGVGDGNLICSTLDQAFYVEATRFPA